jgi:hypothetical protein
MDADGLKLVQRLADCGQCDPTLLAGVAIDWRAGTASGLAFRQLAEILVRLPRSG